ncbi:hypothetical protein ACHAWC_006933 [Mediolabrus comicus]|jgi:hypothetical protein
MSIIAFGDKHPSFLRKTRSEILLRPPRLYGEHKVEEAGETQSQDDEMREEQSETETAESVEETCKRQGHPIVRALTFTKSLSLRNKKQHAASAIEEIEVTLKEDSAAAATEKNEKKGEKKTVTFAEEIRVEEFEVDRTKKMKKTRRQGRNRRAHDDDESDDDEPLAILSCALPIGNKYNVSCGLGLKRDN